MVQVMVGTLLAESRWQTELGISLEKLEDSLQELEERAWGRRSSSSRSSSQSERGLRINASRLSVPHESNKFNF
jgi:hypothetical protein